MGVGWWWLRGLDCWFAAGASWFGWADVVGVRWLGQEWHPMRRSVGGRLVRRDGGRWWVRLASAQRRGLSNRRVRLQIVCVLLKYQVFCDIILP